MYEDIYFLNPQEALKVASQQNRWGEGYFLQVCYYNGEKIKSDLPNLIQLPLNNLLEGLANGIYRIPSKINFDGLELSPEIQTEIEANFNFSIEQVKEYRKKLNQEYFQNSKNAKPDFNEPLRFYLHTNANTNVMQHMSRNIAQALKSMGYDVLLNMYIGMEDRGCLKTLYMFNPHATININHMNNEYISKDTFNFIWFQDRFAVEQLKENQILRKRDYVFHLTKSLSDLLMSRSIQSTYQGFCINTDVYKNRESIERKDKIVMIGSSYKAEFDLIPNKRKNEIVKKLLKFYTSNEDITAESRRNYFNFLRKKYDIKTDVELGQIVNYVKRDGFLLLISKMNLDYELEIYGLGWETHPQLKTYFKGVLPYGEEISKVYNSAKYSLVLGGYVKQQRTLESAASGCIPLVYDSRYNLIGDEDNSCFQESLVFFKKPADIASLIKKNHNVDLNCIVEANSYQHFAQKFVDIIEREKGE